MHYLPFLKTGSKRNNSVCRIILGCLIFFSSVIPLTGIELGSCVYSFSEEGTLVLTFTPESLSEKKIQNNIEQGHKSEIYISYRVQRNSGSYLLVGAEHQEINIRRTGFRDQITGDYVLMLNEREIAVYRDWSLFIKKFLSPIVYPSRIAQIENQNILVKVRSRVIYKKLVPPFSIMYLIPGKFMHSHPWQNAKIEEFL